jgi:RecA-family ATPase
MTELRKATAAYSTEMIIDGLFESGSLNMIASQGGIGKTTFCLQMVSSILSGSDFFGLKTIQRNILWINNELTPSLLVKRWDDINKNINLDNKNIIFNNFEFDLSSEDCLNSLHEYCLLNDINLIFIDSFVASLNGCDENDNGSLSHILKRLRNTFCKDGITVVFLHHLGKIQKLPQSYKTSQLDPSNIRGASCIKDSCDNVFMIAENLDKSRFIKKVKSRNFQSDWQSKFELKDGKFEATTSYELSVEENIINLLKTSEMKQNELCKKVGKDRNLVRETLKQGEGSLWDYKKSGNAYVYYLINDGEENE